MGPHRAPRPGPRRRDKARVVEDRPSPGPNRARAKQGPRHLTIAEIDRRRDASLADLDHAIESMAAELSGLEDAELHHLLKRAVLLRSELRHLDLDWRTVDDRMADIEQRLRRLREQWEAARRARD